MIVDTDGCLPILMEVLGAALKIATAIIGIGALILIGSVLR